MKTFKVIHKRREQVNLQIYLPWKDDFQCRRYMLPNKGYNFAMKYRLAAFHQPRSYHHLQRCFIFKSRNTHSCSEVYGYFSFVLFRQRVFKFTILSPFNVINVWEKSAKSQVVQNDNERPIQYLTSYDTKSRNSFNGNKLNWKDENNRFIYTYMISV